MMISKLENNGYIANKIVLMFPETEGFNSFLYSIDGNYHNKNQCNYPSRKSEDIYDNTLTNRWPP